MTVTVDGLTPYTVCAAVLAVVQDHLARAGRKPAVAYVASGGIVVDSCEGGYLVVAPERVFRFVSPLPTEALPDEQVAGIGLDVVIRLERCVPVLTEAGDAPTVEEQEAGYREVLADAAVVWSACASDDMVLDGEWERSGIDQLFVGPLGGCSGSETRLTVGVPIDDWCVGYTETYEGED